jgi:glucose-1-phosphate adenylyltransferase
LPAIHVYKMDYGRMLAFHVAEQADMTVACIEVPREEASAFGIMQRGRGLARHPLHRKAEGSGSRSPASPERALVSMGVYVFNAGFLFEQLIRDSDDPTSSHDFGKDVIPHIVQRYRVFAHDFAESCVGMPRRAGPTGAMSAPGRLLGSQHGHRPRSRRSSTSMTTLADLDLPGAAAAGQVRLRRRGRRGMAIDSLVSGGCIISGAAVRRSLLFSGCASTSAAWSRTR